MQVSTHEIKISSNGTHIIMFSTGIVVLHQLIYVLYSTDIFYQVLYILDDPSQIPTIILLNNLCVWDIKCVQFCVIVFIQY